MAKLNGEADTLNKEFEAARAKAASELMKKIQNNLPIIPITTPWWWSGSACLAALMWVNFTALSFLALFDLIQLDWVSGLLAVIFFFLASSASMQGYQRNK